MKHHETFTFDSTTAQSTEVDRTAIRRSYVRILNDLDVDVHVDVVGTHGGDTDFAYSEVVSIGGDTDDPDADTMNVAAGTGESFELDVPFERFQVTVTPQTTPSAADDVRVVEMRDRTE